jgi:trehalose/maltose hydrolase-like predicted phosphorylase
VAEYVFPYSEEHQVFYSRMDFLDKELIAVKTCQSAALSTKKWSWDRICSPSTGRCITGASISSRTISPTEQLRKHFDFFTGPFTVHGPRFRPCVHSIQAAKLVRNATGIQILSTNVSSTLDDTIEVEEGYTSLQWPGTWMSVSKVSAACVL